MCMPELCTNKFGLKVDKYMTFMNYNVLFLFVGINVYIAQLLIDVDTIGRF